MKLDVGYPALRSQPVALFEHGCSGSTAITWRTFGANVTRCVLAAAGVKYALAAGPVRLDYHARQLSAGGMDRAGAVVGGYLARSFFDRPFDIALVLGNSCSRLSLFVSCHRLLVNSGPQWPNLAAVRRRC